MAHARHIWRERRQPFMRNLLERLAFIDETSLKTNLVKTTGWAPLGGRLTGHVPFEHWHTQTFIAALRHDGSTRLGSSRGRSTARSSTFILRPS